jgi:hypothetical protein
MLSIDTDYLNAAPREKVAAKKRPDVSAGP